MRIDSVNKIMAAYGNSYNTTKAVKNIKTDELNITSTGSDFLYALQMAKKAPEIREDKVDAIKKQIETGTYNISCEDVARKILQRNY